MKFVVKFKISFNYNLLINTYNNSYQLLIKIVLILVPIKLNHLLSTIQKEYLFSTRNIITRVEYNLYS